MFRDWSRITLALAAALGVAGSRADDEAPSGDLKKLQGTWTTPAGDGGTVSYAFDGRKLKIDAPSRSYVMTVTLDSHARPEKTIDFQIDEGPDDARGKTSKGIYKFDGDDKFVFCFRPEGDRPTKHEQVGFEQFLTELTRKQDKAKPESDKPKAAVEPAEVDTPLPVGWPAPTKPGEIEVKAYPAYRTAITRRDAAGLMPETRMFFSLFNHIQQKGIAMTAPVAMNYDPKTVEKGGRRNPESMEFLYRRPDQGEAGDGVGQVKVEDRPRSTYVSLGHVGRMDSEALKVGNARLKEWVEGHKDDWTVDGDPRVLGYHGPDTPEARQWWEIQLPVKAAEHWV